jgi:hypothetical protein
MRKLVGAQGRAARAFQISGVRCRQSKSVCGGSGLARTGFHWAFGRSSRGRRGLGGPTGWVLPAERCVVPARFDPAPRLVSATSVAVKPSSIDGGFAPWLISRPKGSGTLGTDVLHQTN